MRKILTNLWKNRGNIIQIILFVSMLVIIFQGSPKLAKFILMVDVEDMTHFIEIFLISTLALTVAFTKNK